MFKRKPYVQHYSVLVDIKAGESWEAHIFWYPDRHGGGHHLGSTTGITAFHARFAARVFIQKRESGIREGREFRWSGGQMRKVR